MGAVVLWAARAARLVLWRCGVPVWRCGAVAGAVALWLTLWRCGWRCGAVPDAWVTLSSVSQSVSQFSQFFCQGHIEFIQLVS